MLSRNQIKHLNSLQLNKYRNIHKEFIAEGNKLVLDILSGALEVKALYATPEWLEKNEKVLKKISVTEVPEKELKKISGLTTANEVIAVISIPERDLNIENISSQLTIMLDTIRDPGNLGTIIRTADWFGINNIICSENSVDAYNPKVVQASMGSFTRVQVYYDNLKEVLAKLSPETKVFGTFMDGEDISKKRLQDKGIIIIGNESKGISEDLLPFINEKISIPAFVRKGTSSGKAESLNAAVACAIVCYEFRR